MADLYGLYAQFKTLPKPKGPFTDQIVIVTGSNSGIGVEAARHYANLDAKKVILAVRNLESGNDVKKSIEETTKCSGVVEVWKLDMSSSASIREFTSRVNKELPRLDVAALNAAVLLLPKLYATADQFGVTLRLSITSSGLHADATLTKEMLVDGKSIAWLSTEENVKVENSHCEVSKLLEVFYVQELAKHIERKENEQTKVIVNIIDPGLLLFQSFQTYGSAWRKALYAGFQSSPC
ncbi:hypothetical protein BGW37DRAFT_524169 [Umbelopsis sp. PMI_123]|nr:hypothetical protein BGW37DRAFT_524169 [Umbelopsis sp. PMI_123]